MPNTDAVAPYVVGSGSCGVLCCWVMSHPLAVMMQWCGVMVINWWLFGYAWKRFNCIQILAICLVRFHQRSKINGG